jgi:hypothetical protein
MPPITTMMATSNAIASNQQKARESARLAIGARFATSLADIYDNIVIPRNLQAEKPPYADAV